MGSKEKPFRRAVLCACVLAGLTLAYGNANATNLRVERIKSIAEEAYIYGFPMIAAYKAMYELNIDKASPQYKAPFNRLWSNPKTLTPKDTAVITPNADTPYSNVQMDLRAQPMVLCVPKVEKDRYYSVQLTDMYTFNYGFIGSRTTGDDAGCYLVAGPNWRGKKPAGISKVFRSETQFSIAIFRTQLFNPGDIGNVRKIQSGYRAEPLSAYLHQPAPPPAAPIRFPRFIGDKAFKTDFAAYLNFLLQFCPAVPEEKALRATFASIGIAPGKKFNFKDLPTDEKAAFALAIKQGFEKIERTSRNVGKNINGWYVGAAFGNRAFYNGNWLLRAAAAKGGIYGSDASSAVYPVAHVDSQGDALNASRHRYTLTFAENAFPPVNAFWSVTMYDGKTQLLVANPINRYLINSSMLPTLRRNRDGSVTIFIQRQSPGGDEQANWLPAPNGPFYLVMRLYWPKKTPPSILPPGAGSWKPPGIARGN